MNDSIDGNALYLHERRVKGSPFINWLTAEITRLEIEITQLKAERRSAEAMEETE